MLPTGRIRNFSLIVACAALLSVPARAQDFAAPPHIALVDGQATITHDGEADPAASNIPLVPGDSIDTSGAGRLEILCPDGTTLDLDQYSRLDVLSPTLFRLLEGRMLLTVAGADNPSQAIRYQVDTPVASAETEGPGEYRLSALTYREGPGAELAVVRGDATFWTEQGSVAVAAGERSFARDQEAPSYAVAFNSARFDAFDRWTQSIHDARTTSATARQYLPSELQVYGRTLDQAGVWNYDASYGYVWYPRVAATWRPYYYGRWVGLPAYGWTWIGVDVWSWPTHHYGRWGCRNGAWFWIPGRQWGPAWVSWASASSYVAWSPLGFDGRPVFALSVGVVHPYTSWVYVPRNRFGHAWHADRYAVAPQRIPRATTFVAERRAPIAVPRSPRRDSALATPRSAPPRSRAGANVAAGARSDPGQTRALPRSSSRAPAVRPPGGQSQTGRAPSGVRPQVESPRAVPRAPSVTGRSRQSDPAQPQTDVQGRARSRAAPDAPAAGAPPTISREPRARAAAPGSSRDTAGARSRVAPQVESPRSSPRIEAPRSVPRTDSPRSAPRAQSPPPPQEQPRPSTAPQAGRRPPAGARGRSATPPPAERPSAPAARPRASGGSSGSSSRGSSRASSQGDSGGIGLGIELVPLQE